MQFVLKNEKKKYKIYTGCYLLDEKNACTNKFGQTFNILTLHPYLFPMIQSMRVDDVPWASRAVKIKVMSTDLFVLNLSLIAISFDYKKKKKKKISKQLRASQFLVNLTFSLQMVATMSSYSDFCQEVNKRLIS